jgi:hypothetical protein
MIKKYMSFSKISNQISQYVEHMGKKKKKTYFVHKTSQIGIERWIFA